MKKTVGDLLRNADPLRGEQDHVDAERDRMRRSILAAASAPPATAPPRAGRRRAMLVFAAAIVAAAALAPQFWPRGTATVHAAVRFEVRLAELEPSADLLEARVAGSGGAIYLHREIVATNDDVARGRVVPGSGASYAVAVEFTPEGAEKMRHASAAHIGKPIAILIDGAVVMAPTVRSPIGSSAVITGDFTESEAQRIVDGLR